MEINGVRVVYGDEYFVQVMHVGYHGTAKEIKNGKLVLERGVTFDLREVVLLGSDVAHAQKYNFERAEISINSIHSIRALEERLGVKNENT
ncbi:MAG: hypothetical protein HY438_02610 [DPANN group archaeon]|nr:hypothetical protein [DPANN group archaeon]